MSTESNVSHSNLIDLIELKIPALKGKAADNNRKVLEVVALNGPLLKYGILKLMGGRYSTVSRRIDDLNDRGYLSEAGTRTTKRGRQSEETKYGLTWKGLVASLSIQTVRKKILQVLRKNSQLNIPEREFVLVILDEIFSEEDIEIMATSFFTGFLNSTAPPLDDILEEDLKSWLIPAFRAAPHSQLKSTGTMNLFTLLDNPQILHYVKENYIPMIVDYEKQLYEAYRLIKMVNEIGKFVSTLKPEDRPSEKIVEYLEKTFPDLVSEVKDVEEDIE